MADKLLRCPFCGAGTDIRTSRIPRSTAFRIRCDCGAQMEWSGSDIDEDRVRSGIIAAWNRRQTHPSAVPVGWKLVPVEPTPAMLDAYAGTRPADDHVDFAHEDRVDAAQQVYRAMVSAAPPAPSAWRPIETCPTARDERFLVWDDCDGTVRMASWESGFDRLRQENYVRLSDDALAPIKHATHWMPIPAPPASAAEAPHA